MQKVRGSNPLSSTGFPDLCSIVKNQAKNLSVLGFLVTLVGVFVAEYVVHHGRSATDGRDDIMAVDGLGDVGGLVAYYVADVLDRYTLLDMIDSAVCRPSW